MLLTHIQSKLTNLHRAVKTNAPVLCWNSSNNPDTAVSEPTKQKITLPYLTNT